VAVTAEVPASSTGLRDLLAGDGLYAKLWGVRADEIDELPEEFVERARERRVDRAVERAIESEVGSETLE